MSRFSPVSLRAEPIATDEEETDQYEREGEERERERERKRTRKRQRKREEEMGYIRKQSELERGSTR